MNITISFESKDAPDPSTELSDSQGLSHCTIHALFPGSPRSSAQVRLWGLKGPVREQEDPFSGRTQCSSSAGEGADLSKQLQIPVPEGRQHLPRGSVHYSTIWNRFQKLRLLTSGSIQREPPLHLLLESMSKGLLTFPRKVEGSKWIHPSQREVVVLMEICLFKTPKAVRSLVVPCLSPNSASLRDQFTLTLCYLLPLTHHPDLLLHSRFKYEGCHPVKPGTHMPKPTSVAM